MMRILLISFCWFLCISDTESITWNTNNKLTWEDFKAKSKPEVDAVALTVSGISFSYSLSQKDNEDYVYKTFIEAHFYPEKSWFKTESASDYILSHEQLHFDITELYARKFRKRVKEFNFTKNIRFELNQINEAINNELEEIQNTYDKETNHSINQDMQKKWQSLIESELEKLSNYKSSN